MFIHSSKGLQFSIEKPNQADTVFTAGKGKLYEIGTNDRDIKSDKVVKFYANLCNCEELYNQRVGVSNVIFYSPVELI